MKYTDSCIRQWANYLLKLEGGRCEARAVVLKLPLRESEDQRVRGIDYKIGLGIAWSREDSTASRDDIVEIAKSMVRRG